MKMYFAKDGSYGDAEGLVILDSKTFPVDLLVMLSEEESDNARYFWAREGAEKYNQIVIK